MLLTGLGCQSIYDGDILQKLLRQTVPLHYVVRAVVRNPNFPLAIFPNQNLQRHVDCNAGSSYHKRCACFGTAKNQQLSWAHTHSHFSASPLWSTSANRVIPLDCRIFLSFSTVYSTE